MKLISSCSAGVFVAAMFLYGCGKTITDKETVAEVNEIIQTHESVSASEPVGGDRMSPTDGSAVAAAVSDKTTSTIDAVSLTGLTSSAVGSDCGQEFYVVEKIPESPNTKSAFFKGGIVGGSTKTQNSNDPSKRKKMMFTIKNGESWEVYPLNSNLIPIYSEDVKTENLNTAIFTCTNGVGKIAYQGRSLNSDILFINFDIKATRIFKKATCGFNLNTPNTCPPVSITTTINKPTYARGLPGAFEGTTYNHISQVTRKTAAAGNEERVVHELWCSPGLPQNLKNQICPVLNTIGLVE